MYDMYRWTDTNIYRYSDIIHQENTKDFGF